ncbi:MAG: hypothetical protein IKA37_04035, partial [Spirochaetales bacterium]|nr:hypothetical protein [Spirochaetales bacterium]
MNELVLYKDKECKLAMINNEKGNKITVETTDGKKVVIQ